MLKTGERALILAHREELLTQARDKLSHAAPSLHVEIEQAQKRASKHINGWTKNLRQIDRSVVVASIQTLRGKRLQSWKPDTFSCIVVDEAHHSTAGSYIDILKHFGCFDPERRTRLVGVTATPGRTDGVGLGAVYQEIAADWGIRELIKLGWLCPLTARRVTSEISLANVKTSHGDFVQADLERTIDVSSRNELIVGAYEEHAAGERTIVFAAAWITRIISRIYSAQGGTMRKLFGVIWKKIAALKSWLIFEAVRFLFLRTMESLRRDSMRRQLRVLSWRGLPAHHWSWLSASGEVQESQMENGGASYLTLEIRLLEKILQQRHH